jgi:hypothetical protein
MCDMMACGFMWFYTSFLLGVFIYLLLFVWTISATFLLLSIVRLERRYHSKWPVSRHEFKDFETFDI